MSTTAIPEGPVRDLLAAVLDGIDIPYPATVGDSERYVEVLADRVMHVRLALGEALGGSVPLGIEWTTEYLLERLADVPPTGYRHAGGDAR